MEIEFYLKHRLYEKKNARGSFELGIFWLQTNALESTAIRDLLFERTFDKILQISSNLKFAKAELYLIGGYQDEWFELTYYIETLV